MDLRELQRAYLEKEREVTAEKLGFGSLVRTELTDEDGMNFKDGRSRKPKLLVIVGVDLVNRVCYGTVLVNTKPNPRAKYSEEYKSAQYLLQYSNYPHFLKYDSYVDCGCLLTIPFARLERGEYFGCLVEQDKHMIKTLLETSETISPKMKKRFGII
jgi:hypothetical protein